MKTRDSLLAAIMLLLLLTAALPTAAAISPSTIYLYTADDLFQLAKDCSFDRWSLDRTVILGADIDLEGRDFTPIPIFLGLFDGQGHTIRGLSIGVEGNVQGLFRYLEKNGIVRGLTVEGTVAPGGDRGYIGGIVGKNSGLLDSCSFAGNVKGKDAVGGLVGWNCTSGRIVNCAASGDLYGESKVGGIAGYNAGTILRCRNYSQVNTVVEEHKLDLQQLTVEQINLSKLFLNTIDTGGLAGVNTGVIQTSQNHGQVGYPRVGYNVGGIAGRQSGYLTGCENHGQVLGLKDVGGIVGQVEPHLSAVFPPSKLKALQRELGILQSSIAGLLGDARLSSGLINTSLSSIEKELDQSKALAESLIDQTEGLINQDMDEINRISITATEAIARLVPIIDDMAELLQETQKAMRPIKESLYSFSDAMGELKELLHFYDQLSTGLDYTLIQLTVAGEHIEAAFSFLLQALEALYQGEIERVPELLSSCSDHFAKAEGNVEQALNGLTYVRISLEGMVATLGELGQDMDRALSYLQIAITRLERAGAGFPGILQEIAALMGFLAEQPQLEFATTDDHYQETKENLFRSIDTLSRSVFQLFDLMGTQGDLLIGDLEQVSDQLFKVLDLLLAIVGEIGSGELALDQVIEDVSRTDIAGKTEGKVAQSKNWGRISGDTNVGGIAGAMAMELIPDGENEWNLGNKPLFRSSFQTRAVISECENAGQVMGKKNNIGGIVGSMDLGYIHGCVVTGAVESSGGDYVGGIAGQAYAPIERSYVKSALQGGNYVGGIAGLGQEILGCYTMVSIDRSRAYVGAIAGARDQNSTIKDNYFVHDRLAGIDGVSYMGQAEPLSYAVFVATDGLPQIFDRFRLSFWAEGELVETIEFFYGSALTAADLPPIPEKAGHYGCWPPLDLTDLRFDAEIAATYAPNITLLESAEKRDGPLSLILVEGKFRAEDSLALRPIAEQEAVAGGGGLTSGHLLEQWQVDIPEDGETIHTIRFIPPKKSRHLAIFVAQDGAWLATESEWDGKYMVFRAPGNSVVFSLVQKGFQLIWHLALIGTTAALAAGLWIARRGKRKPPAALDPGAS